MNELTQAKIREHMIAAYPNEGCGVVIVERGKEKFVPCKNLAQKKGEQFIMDPEDFANAEERGEVVEIVHSHPNASAVASQADLVSCEMTQKPWRILAVWQDLPEEGKETTPYIQDERVFEPSGYKAPLVGREFHHGVLDCYSMIRDWYSEEQGIELPNWPRTDGWWERGEDLYMKLYKESGFVRVDDEPQVGDIFLMQIRSEQPNHGAIYIGDGKILHHLYGRLSSRDIYGGYWQEVTVLRVRHRSNIQ